MAEASRVIGFTELKERYLPQRYPLLLLDRVTGFAAGEWIEAIKAVTGNSPDLVGHFPERAILPGSAMMQSFAQLGIVFFKVTNGALADNELTVVTSFKIRLMAPVIPGEIMRLRLAARRFSPTVGVFRGDAEVDGRKVAAVTLTIAKTRLSTYADIPW
ncbi:3-hydroxyacyl-ACP dehydratase FabZ family protein [Tistrella mobilis]|uniref:3-hydroxyacyl-ACP dehydratase FabZ family protein n=1 Tax=Tistrella mobilis TaxID=171437 RepID=UPI003557FC3C